MDRKNKKKENLIYFIVAILCIIILSFISVMKIKSFEKNKNNLLKEGYVPIELPEFDLNPLPKETGIETFKTEDEKLELIFPNNWNTKNGEQILKAIKGDAIYGDGIETVFVAYKIEDIQANPSFFLVGETKKNIKDVLQESFGIDKSFLIEGEGEEGREIAFKEEIENIEIVELKKNSVFLDIKYKEKDAINLHSFVKTVTFEDISYIITLTTFQQNWEKEKTEFLEILNF